MPEIQEFRTIESGKLSDLRFYTDRGEWNSVDNKFYTTIEFYENNSTTPVRTKKLEILPHINQPDTDVIIGGQDVFITDYILNSTCQWTNLYDSIGVVVIPINSRSEMEKYITCSAGDFADIDFSGKTLLLASGTARTGIGKFHKRLLILEGQYILDVGIMLGGTQSKPEEWIIAIVTDKIATTDIRLHVVAR